MMETEGETETGVVLNEGAALNLEEQLMDHLGDPESAMSLYRQRFNRDFVSERDYPEVLALLDWVFGYIDEHKKAPATEVVQYEFDIEFEPAVTDIEWLISEFRTRWKRNEAKRILLTATRRVGADPDEAIDVALAGMAEVRARTIDRRNEMDGGDFGLAIEEYNQRVLGGQFDWPTFGFADIDKVLMGIKGLVYVIGRPKRFKSWFLLKAAVENQFSENPRPGIFYTLEMTEREMFGRYICMVAGISYGAYMRGTLTQKDMAALKDAQELVTSLPPERRLTFAHPPRNAGERTVQGLLAGAKEKEAGVCYLDQLKFIESTRAVPLDKRFLEIEYINEDLKDMSEEMPTYIACQFNREAASMAEMADLSKIGLSDSIGQTADMLLGLYQDKAMKQNNIIEFGTIESRNFEMARFHIRVEVGDRSDFRYIERLTDF